MPEYTARQAAVQALMKVNGEGGYSNLVLNETLKKSGLSPVDTSFASRLFYGALERKLTLDHIIGAYSKKPVSKLTPAVAEILRISLYQMLYLDNVPDAAAVDEAVKLTRRMKVSSASGFVNAVLRSFLRDEKKIPPVKGNRLRKLEVRYSCPQWIIRELLENYGEEATIATLERSLDRPPLYARVNTTKISVADCVRELEQEGVKVQVDEQLEGCIQLFDTASLEKLQSFEKGLFYIQDKSSQLCACSLQAQQGQRVLDSCAAPGSKSFSVAQQMNNEGEILSCDIHAHKKKLIEAGAARLGLGSIRAMVQDGKAFRPDQEGAFDLVLADVPCSGLGIIRKKPDIRYKDREPLAGLPEVQSAILDNVARYVRPGGVLLYATCTLLERENEGVVSRFLAGRSDWRLEAFTLPGPVGRAEEGMVTLWPHIHGTDGFFVAKLRRQG